MSEISFLGLGKVKYGSSVANLATYSNSKKLDVEVCLTERLSRKKNSGEWPWRCLDRVLDEGHCFQHILENRDVDGAREYEDYLDSRFPFYDFLKKKKLEKYTSKFNREVQAVEHHLAHAKMAELFSPYDKALIWVLDGAGSIQEGGHEYDSLYSFESPSLNLLERRTSPFYQNKAGKWVSESIGIIYETISEYIFGSKLMAGKVMGLASFGQVLTYENPLQMIDDLDWSLAFKGNSKAEWEASSNMKMYQNLAATTQKFFETYVLDRTGSFEKKYPEYDHLVIVGGCALNCTCNQKIIDQTKYKSLYVPPAPGDSGISLGLAYLGLNQSGKSFKASEKSHIRTAFLGAKSSVPTDSDIEKVFSGYKIQKIEKYEEVCRLLADGHVIAWFQGRSEIGPRALGHRSLLANIEKKGLKNFLNREIKFRESFRPYGCSVAAEKASQYFDIAEDFKNPYMSFASRVRENFKNLLNEVTHIDGTSRMQTVERDENPRFYQLLTEWGQFSGHPILLNTSLNIMGQPILENIKDAHEFLESSSVQHMVIEDYIVSKK